MEKKVHLLEQLKKITRQIALGYHGGDGYRKRMIIVVLFLLFLLDYLMFCHLTEKNVFAIFPPIPALKKTHEVTLFLPTFNDMSIEKEEREIPLYEDSAMGVMRLFDEVARGSKFENTSLFVPVEVFVRKVWLINEQGGIKGQDGGSLHCVIDVEPGLLDSKTTVIPGSEELFLKALEKTIRQNIPSIVSVTVLELGIPGTRIWDRSIAGEDQS